MCTRICIWKNRPICTLYTMDWLYRAIQSRYTDTFVKYTIPAQLAFDSLSSITWWRMVCWKDLQNSRLNFFTESYIHSRIVSNMPFVMLNMYFVCPSGCRRFDCKQKGEIKKKVLPRVGLCHTLSRRVHFITSCLFFCRTNRFTYLTFDPDDNDGVVDDDDNDDDYGRKKKNSACPKNVHKK